MNTTDLTKVESQLNEMTRQGKIDNCTFQEGTQPARKGRSAQHAHLSGFLRTLKAFNGAKLHAQAVGDGATISEWTFDMTGPEGPIQWNEVLSRRWRDGKVVSERFYTAS